MLIFKSPVAQNLVNNNRALFEVRNSVEVLRTPHLALGQTLTMTWYSSILAYRT